MDTSRIGASPKRREDARFVTGQGAYLDDLPFEKLSRAVFVRSPHAHARLRSIDTDAARRAPGVLAVLTAADVEADGLKALRPYAEANVQTGERFIFDEQPLLAADKVRFVGETVALVVAVGCRHHGRRRHRIGRAATLGRGAGQRLHGLAYR
jgi:carbon-monoxide dehydrogenase large subunit